MSDTKQATPMEAMQAALDHAKWLLKNAPVCELSAHNEAVRNWALEWDQRAVNAEAALAAANEANVKLRAEVERLQARIDELMLEYCPGDMTDEQIANYWRNQRPATEQEAAAIDAARKG